MTPQKYIVGDNVQFVGDPEVLKYPVKYGTRGTYQGPTIHAKGVAEKEEYHWVHFVGTTAPQMVRFNEIKPWP